MTDIVQGGCGEPDSCKIDSDAYISKWDVLLKSDIAGRRVHFIGKIWKFSATIEGICEESGEIVLKVRDVTIESGEEVRNPYMKKVSLDRQGELTFFPAVGKIILPGVKSFDGLPFALMCEGNQQVVRDLRIGEID